MAAGMQGDLQNERSSLYHDAKRALRAICPRPILNWREARYYGRYGEVELHIVKYLCQRERDSIDVGAHDGCYIHFMRRHSRRVVAYEPLPWLAQELARKFRRRVIVSDIALSRSAGRAVLRVPIVDGAPVLGCSSISEQASATYKEHRDIRVRADTLDHAYAGDVGFIKIDVEGHEEAVLDGARATIARCRPRLLIEIDERLNVGGFSRISRRLGGMGYRGAFILQNRLQPLRAFDPARMQRPEDHPGLTAPLKRRRQTGSYIYNFLFFPEGESADSFEKIERRLSGA